MSTPIFPGAFQPFHQGHLLVAQGMMKAMGEAVIVICEAKDSTSELFSVDERREMISAALLAADIDDAVIAVVRDDADDAVWLRHMLDAAGNPSEPVIWSGDERVRAAAEAAGVVTKKIVPVPGIASADVRADILAGGPEWRKKVPSGALDVVERVVDRRKKMGA